jgi:hypothetical protein
MGVKDVLKKAGKGAAKVAKVAVRVAQDEDFQRLVARIGYFNAFREWNAKKGETK